MDLIVSALLLIGTFFIFIGSLGVLRLPDFFCRAHSLTKSMTLGITLILLSSLFYIGIGPFGFKIFVILVFQYVTIPISGHIIGYIAFRKNIPRWKHQPIADHRVIKK